MTYRKTLDYLYQQLPMFHRVGAAAYKADLENTEAINRFLGHPERLFKSVHIAGTNGKGSTSHFLASVLQEAGYKTGLFTSPHLKDFRERIRVNGKMIPKTEVTAFVEKHRKSFDAVKPSFFEWTFGLASDFFARQDVDIAILETGMGGRLDSTNIVTPIVSVITNIGFDHMQFLGDTLEKIATEKAGIIKDGIPVVIGETQAETAMVFQAIAAKCNSPLLFADQSFRIIDSHYGMPGKPGLTAKIKEYDTGRMCSYYSTLAGHYQLKNLLTVLATVDQIRKNGYSITDRNVFDGIRKVIRNTGLKGRWQILSKNPLTIADIGHNSAGMREVVRQLKVTPHNHLHFVIGVVNDKDVEAMLMLLPEKATYYFCKANIPRGLDAALLQDKARRAGLRGNSYSSVKLALEEAHINAGTDDLVVVGGSAFVVAEVL